jgi:hypothetical protein
MYINIFSAAFVSWFSATGASVASAGALVSWAGAFVGSFGVSDDTGVSFWHDVNAKIITTALIIAISFFILFNSYLV